MGSKGSEPLDNQVAQFLRLQLEKDWELIFHIDKLFHDMLRFFLALLSALAVALWWLYRTKLDSTAPELVPSCSGLRGFLGVMRGEVACAASIALLVSVLLYLYALYKRRMSADAMVSINLIRTAFVKSSANPEFVHLHMHHPITHRGSRGLGFIAGRASGMDSIYMYLTSASAALMAAVLVFTIWHSLVLAVIMFLLVLIGLVALYLLFLRGVDRRLSRRHKPVQESGLYFQDSHGADGPESES